MKQNISIQDWRSLVYGQQKKIEDFIGHVEIDGFTVGYLIEVIEELTGEFPVPMIFDFKDGRKFAIKITWRQLNGRVADIFVDYQPSYCDALWKVFLEYVDGYLDCSK